MHRIIGFTVWLVLALTPHITPVPDEDITLTSDEKYSIRTAEFHELAARGALVEADHDLAQAIGTVYNNHHTTPEKHSLCAGPGQHPCEQVNKDDIVLKKNPEKTPEKKDK